MITTQRAIKFDTRRYIKSNDRLNMIRIPTTMEQIDSNLPKIIKLLEEVSITYMKTVVEYEEEGSAIFMDVLKKIIELGIISGLDLMSEEPLEIIINQTDQYKYYNHTTFFIMIDKYMKKANRVNTQPKCFMGMIQSYFAYLVDNDEFKYIERVMGEYFKEA